MHPSKEIQACSFSNVEQSSVDKVSIMSHGWECGFTSFLLEISVYLRSCIHSNILPLPIYSDAVLLLFLFVLSVVVPSPQLHYGAANDPPQKTILSHCFLIHSPSIVPFQFIVTRSNISFFFLTLKGNFKAFIGRITACIGRIVLAVNWTGSSNGLFHYFKMLCLISYQECLRLQTAALSCMLSIKVLHQF